MAQLNDLPTSELIQVARFYLKSSSGIPLPDDIATEALNRLDCALVAARQAIKERDDALESVIPEGFAVVPDRISIPAESMEGICFHCGDGGHKFGAFTEGTLFIGEVENDDGSKVYGIHIATADYPEEGCATICEFAQPLRKESGQ